MLATEGTWREAQRPVDNGRASVDLALVASVGLMLAIGLFLAVRRASGAFDAPLPPVPLVATTIGLLAWSTAVRLRLHDRLSGWLLAAVFALFAVGCSYPAERIFDWLVWLPAFAAFGLLPTQRRLSIGDSDKATGQLLQELTRTRSADGVEVIRGTVAAEFAPGERMAILHIAFCPPFERIPKVQAEVAAGPAGDLKIAQILHQGARLEVRLSRASTSARRTTIEFVATSHPPMAD